MDGSSRKQSTPPPMDSSSSKMDSSSRRMDMSSRSTSRRLMLGGKFKMSFRNLMSSSAKHNSNNGSMSTSHHNYNDSISSLGDTAVTSAPATFQTISSTTPTNKKKLRIRGTSKRQLTDLDDIMEPSARALHQQQEFQQQLALKSRARRTSSDKTSNSNENATTECKGKTPPLGLPPLNSATTPPIVIPKNSSAVEMRQRLREIEVMIARGKEEMLLLQTGEAVKIQAAARGLLVRKRLQRGSIPVVATSSGTTKRTKGTKGSYNNSNDISTRRGTKKLPTITTANTKIKKLPAKKNSNESTSPPASHKGGDHYTWDTNSTSNGTDHYAWEEPLHPSSRDRKFQQPMNNNNSKRSAKKSTSDSKNNLDKTSDSKVAKSKAERVRSNDNNGLKDLSHNSTGMKDTITVDGFLDTHDSAINKNKRGSFGIMSFEQLNKADVVHENKSKNDDVAMNSPAMVVAPKDMTEDDEENVFEDSSANSDQDIISGHASASHRSSAHSGHSLGRLSVASSFMSRLTVSDGSNGDDEYGLLEHVDGAGHMSNSGYLLEDSEEEVSVSSASQNLLSLSVMATAPKENDKYYRSVSTGNRAKHARNKKTHTDISREGLFRTSNQEQPALQDQDNLSVSVLSTSVMATASPESDIELSRSTDSDFDLIDENETPYSGSSFYKSKKRTWARTGKIMENDNDVFSVSVMAVAADVSDWEGESEVDADEYSDDDDDDISNLRFYDDYDDDDDDVYSDEGYLSDSAIAVAASDETTIEDDASHVDGDHNLREDDMSITTCETNLPKESDRRDRSRRRRERRRSRDLYEDESEAGIIDAEDVSVLTTDSHKRHKKRHQLSTLIKTRRRSRKALRMQHDTKLNLLGQYLGESSDSDDEDLLDDAIRRDRRTSKKSLRQTEEEALQLRLAEVNRLIAATRQELEEIKFAEARRIQSFARMLHARANFVASGQRVTKIRTALSRAGTKETNMAAAKIQAIARGIVCRSKPKAFSSDKRLHKNRKRPAQGEGKAAKEALQKQLEKVEHEIQEETKRAQTVLERKHVVKIQALARGVLERTNDHLNPEKIAAVKIQRFVRAVLRIIKLHKNLAAIAEEKIKELQAVEESRKTTIAEFTPGKFDKMDTLIKLVKFLKDQIQKENENHESFAEKIKIIKKENVRLRTANSTDVCAVSRLQIDIETKEEKKKSLEKLNQEWLDCIADFKTRIERVDANIKVHQLQKSVAEKWIMEVVDLVDEKCSNKKLIREIKFLANHTEVAGGHDRLKDEGIELPM